MKYRVYTTKVEDNLGRVWDIGNGEHMPMEENVWAVNAWTEPVEAVEESTVAGTPATEMSFGKAA